MTTTRPFDTTGPFVVRVETQDYLTLEVKAPTAQFGTARLSTDGTDAAEVYVPRGGRYLLDVMAMGHWQVTITSP